jgi:hypothetical protein
MHNQLILVVAVVLSSCLPGEAQTLATQAFLARASPETATMSVRASPTHLPLNFSLASRLPRTAVAQFTDIPADQRDSSLESRLQIEEVKTLFVTESRLPVVQFWRGSLQLDGFDSSLHMQNIQLGPSGSGGLPPSHDQAGVSSSVGLDGISLGFRFGRDAQTKRPPQTWRCLAWIIGKSRGCPL